MSSNFPIKSRGNISQVVHTYIVIVILQWLQIFNSLLCLQKGCYIICLCQIALQPRKSFYTIVLYLITDPKFIVRYMAAFHWSIIQMINEPGSERSPMKNDTGKHILEETFNCDAFEILMLELERNRLKRTHSKVYLFT